VSGREILPLLRLKRTSPRLRLQLQSPLQPQYLTPRPLFTRTPPISLPLVGLPNLPTRKAQTRTAATLLSSYLDTQSLYPANKPVGANREPKCPSTGANASVASAQASRSLGTGRISINRRFGDGFAGLAVFAERGGGGKVVLRGMERGGNLRFLTVGCCAWVIVGKGSGGADWGWIGGLIGERVGGGWGGGRI
jgi:hypothetical protein